MVGRLLVSVLLVCSTLSSDNFEEKIKLQNQNVVQAAAKELSKRVPQKIDKYTKIVKIKGEGESLVYTFEIDIGSKSDQDIIKEDRSRMEKAVVHGICNTSKRFLQSGINISYIYISARSKKELFRFDVNKKDCQK